MDDFIDRRKEEWKEKQKKGKNKKAPTRYTNEPSIWKERRAESLTPRPARERTPFPGKQLFFRDSPRLSSHLSEPLMRCESKEDSDTALSNIMKQNMKF